MKKHVTVLLLSLALTIFPGCGQAEDMPLGTKDMSSETNLTVEDAPWRTEGFAASGEPEKEQAFWTGQYLPWEYGSQAAGTRIIYEDFGVCGELFWRFGTEVDADETVTWESEREYFLEIYDTISGESTVKQFTPKELGLENEHSILYSMDMPDSGHYVFRGMGYELNEEGVCLQTVDRMIYTDLAGEVQSTDFWEIYREKGITYERESDSTDELKDLPLIQDINWCCDGKGNICVIKPGSNGSSKLFLLFDRNSELLLEYKGTAEQQFVDPLRTRDGELIMPVYDSMEKCYEFLWADTADGELRSLGRMESSNSRITKMCGLLGDDIYYETTYGIIIWNIKSGKRVQVFDYKAAGLDTGFQTMLALRPGQTPVLRLRKKQGSKTSEWLAVLEDHELPARETIRVVALTDGGEYGSSSVVSKCATLTSLLDPNIRYQFEDASESRDRIMAELVSGKGPDMLYVTMEDMYMLDEKGLLLDLDELIPGELREELLPGALGLGTAVSGTLKGVPVVVWSDTLVVSRETWPEDTWKLEDVIGLMEEGKLTGAIYLPTLQTSYLNPVGTIRWLVEYSLGDSFLIDWQNRKSHFDDERFISLLKVTQTDLSSAPEPETCLNGGKQIMAYSLDHESYINDLFVLLEEENGRCVGYPTEGTGGSFLNTPGVLVVNANIAQKEAAVDFLKTLLGEELQSQRGVMGLSVRKLSPEKGVQMTESGTAFYYGREMAVFSDGTTAPQRAAAFLESCAAPPRTYSRILSIILEELIAMRDQNLSPEVTAANINNRVQLYLDEGN